MNLIPAFYDPNPPVVAKIFKNGNSQAVRLPKKFRFDTDEVLIERVVNGILIRPKLKDWNPLLNAIEALPDDFEFERETPEFKDKDLF